MCEALGVEGGEGASYDLIGHFLNHRGQVCMQCRLLLLRLCVRGCKRVYGKENACIFTPGRPRADSQGCVHQD